MAGMRAAQLGVLLLAISLSTQVFAKNSTFHPGNSTAGWNDTTAAPNTQSTGNSATGSASLPNHLSTGLLLPVAVATTLMHRYC